MVIGRRWGGGGGSGVASEAGLGGDYGEAIFAVVDSAAVGEDVNICAFGTELAVSLKQYNVGIPLFQSGKKRDKEGLAHLGKVFADGFRGNA